MNPARPLIDGVGLGPAYHAFWWRFQGGRRPIATEWNRRHRAIFIHVPKTAGLSLFAAMGMDRPPDSHAPAIAWRREDPLFFDQAFRFAVARNPWDRMVSAFFYLKQGSRFAEDRAWAARMLEDVASFDDFLAALERPWFRNRVMAWRHFLPQSHYLAINGALAVNRLIDFNELEVGARAVAERLGAPYRPVHKNRSQRGDYRRYFNDRAVELVASLYADDIALLGADFEATRSNAPDHLKPVGAHSRPHPVEG